MDSKGKREREREKKSTLTHSHMSKGILKEKEKNTMGIVLRLLKETKLPLRYHVGLKIILEH